MYDKKEIMTRAHIIRKETGCTMSEALCKSWAEAKIAIIDGKLFDLNIKDRWSREDCIRHTELSNQLTTLYSKINPVVKKVLNPALDMFERMDIEDRMVKIMYSSRPDWNEYKALEARLYVAA